MTLDEQDIVNNIPVSDLLQNISARLFSLHEENRRLFGESVEQTALRHSNDAIHSLRGALDHAKAIIRSLLDSLVDIDGKQVRELKAAKEARAFLQEEVKNDIL